VGGESAALVGLNEGGYAAYEKKKKHVRRQSRGVAQEKETARGIPRAYLGRASTASREANKKKRKHKGDREKKNDHWGPVNRAREFAGGVEEVTSCSQRRELPEGGMKKTNSQSPGVN